jgi:hypothetical protein
MKCHRLGDKGRVAIFAGPVVELGKAIELCLNRYCHEDRFRIQAGFKAVEVASTIVVMSDGAMILIFFASATRETFGACEASSLSLELRVI